MRETVESEMATILASKKALEAEVADLKNDSGRKLEMVEGLRNQLKEVKVNSWSFS